MARKVSHSKDKYQELIKNELNGFLRKMSDPRLTMCSITKVELNNDYSAAKVYWDTYNQEAREDIQKAFDGAKGKMRTLLAKVLNVRHTPEVNFSYDSQAVDELRITELLKESGHGQT